MNSGERPRVCVTGASGYIATHIVRELLERGYRVRGTARDLGDASKIGHLQALARHYPGRLELVAADLLVAGSFDRAVAECPFVIHTASPVRLAVSDPERDLIRPALEGTRNVFASVRRAKCVRKLVITSSMAAVSSDGAQRRFTESDWNTTATVKGSPYPLSKTLAEREAWKLHGELEPTEHFELVAMNPTVVLGPVLSSHHVSSSPQLVKELIGGKYPLLPRLHFDVVDVRDVARAHVLALESDEVKGRHILFAHGAWLSEMAGMLRTEFPSAKIPRHRMPDALMYTAALFDKRINWGFLRRHLGKSRAIDNTKSRLSLGLEYRPLDQTLRDTARSLLELEGSPTPRPTDDGSCDSPHA